MREFKLPDVGEGVAEGELVSWLVEEGDTVSEDQPVAEVETDKALVEVPAPVNGTVRELRAEEGEMVPVGTVIITFDVEGEPVEDAASADEETASEAERSSEPPGVDEPGDGAEAGETTSGNGDASAEPGTTGEETDEPATPDGRVFAPPRVRRLAREEGISLGEIRGSGPGGRVTEADVYAAAEGGGSATERTETADSDEATADPAQSADSSQAAGQTRQPQQSASPSAAADSPNAADAADRERTLAAPATRRLAREEGVDLDAVPATEERDGEAFVTPEAVREYAEAQQRAQEADAAAVSAGAGGPQQDSGQREERIPYRGVRKAIGDQMERSKYTAPHVTHFDDVDVTELVETRKRLKERADEQGIRLTYMPFVMKAVVAALKEYPLLNSQLDEEAAEIVQQNDYHIGVAVATDAGLMVPVVENVDRKGLLQIASEMNELIQKAQDRSIALEEMQGGTFTITNVGGIGGTYATPIINHPEVGILALGSIEEKPRVVDGSEARGASDDASGETASKEIVPRHVLPLSLSFDHRVLDGAIAARFTNTLAEYLQDPELLLLE
ncbi:2-oxo acid dehydrogenase subunit E2 [Halobacteria archaeon AArc-m2/3/4]|uniref:2-oxo acid dehydrogenase subunit E2 n=1 Tax=Natronoglomus mannanivorans TaxID=2979990 RepID=A0ABT2QAA8_9EURY|nr:2-oxo acid dehydrogenase subunit E2 [Halobacteria archaeon AArc-m2/3/4]